MTEARIAEIHKGIFSALLIMLLLFVPFHTKYLDFIKLKYVVMYLIRVGQKYPRALMNAHSLWKRHKISFSTRNRLPDWGCVISFGSLRFSLCIKIKTNQLFERKMKIWKILILESWIGLMKTMIETTQITIQVRS